MNIKGIFFSLIANVLFGIMYYFSILLLPLSGESIFAFRIIVVLPFILAALILFNKSEPLKPLLQRIQKKPYLLLIIFISALLSGLQLWLFLWAGGNGYAIDVSIGYLLLPIMMAALGKFFFKEQFSKIKNIAIGIAFFGVLSNIISLGTFSWASLVVCIGYPIYWLLRKHFDLNYLAVFALELIMLLPISFYFIYQINLDLIIKQNPNLYLYLILLGLISGSAFILYIFSSQLLPINILGLLGYLEPMIMLLVSFFIGEVLPSESYFLMFCLLIAISLLIIDGIKQ